MIFLTVKLILNYETDDSAPHVQHATHNEYMQ